MKIYRKLVLDLLSFQVLEEDSYEYDGPIDECKGENQIFKQQQAGAYGGISGTTGSMNNFYNIMNGMMAKRFGAQSKTFNQLSRSLNQTLRQSGGPGYFDFNAGGGMDGLGTGQNAGEANGRGAGGGVGDVGGLFGGAGKYGYNPGLYEMDFKPASFYGDEEAALRTEATEQNTNTYRGANQAFGARAEQLGVNAPGLMSAGLSDMLAQQAAQEATGQRQVSLFGAQNQREDVRAFLPIQAQLTLGQAGAFQNAAAMRMQEMAQNKALAAARSGQNAMSRQQAQEFAARMQLAGAELQSNNYFRGIGALSGLGGMQDPLGYGGLGLQGLSGAGGLWGNVYNTGSQGMVQTRSNPLWGQLIGGALGGAMTGGFGAGGMFTNLFKS